MFIHPVIHESEKALYSTVVGIVLFVRVTYGNLFPWSTTSRCSVFLSHPKRDCGFEMSTFNATLIYAKICPLIHERNFRSIVFRRPRRAMEMSRRQLLSTMVPTRTSTTVSKQFGHHKRTRTPQPLFHHRQTPKQSICVSS
jgi:hypothetical protein